MAQNDAAAHLMVLDAGAPIVVLGGIHTGCWELFANDSVRTLRELKGKTVAAPEEQPPSVRRRSCSFVGLDPNKDVTWINHELGATRCGSSRKGRSMPSWASCRSPRSCGRRRSDTC